MIPDVLTEEKRDLIFVNNHLPWATTDSSLYGNLREVWLYK